MSDFEELVATKLANKVEKLVNERVEAALKGDLATGYLNQKQLCKYLGISVTTFITKIKPLGPPTIVIDGVVRYKVESVDRWIRDNFEVWNDEYIPEKTRTKR